MKARLHFYAPREELPWHHRGGRKAERVPRREKNRLCLSYYIDEIKGGGITRKPRVVTSELSARSD